MRFPLRLAAARMPALPARVLPLVRLVGPYGWIALGLAAGAFAAHRYLRRTKPATHPRDEAFAESRWEGEGGSPHPAGVSR